MWIFRWVALPVLLHCFGCADISWGKFYEVKAAKIPVTRVYLFATLTQTMGGFGGRSGADALCQTARNATVFPENQCTDVRAFISLSSEDEIVDLPANYGMPSTIPFYANTTLLGNNLADMLDATINATLSSAGYPMANGWYSFSSLATGVFDAGNCSGGTDSSGVGQGRYGVDNSNTITWMSMTQTGCNNLRHLLCVCF